MSFQQEIQSLPRSFNLNDLNQQQLLTSVNRETRHIYDGRWSRNNRSFEKIREDTIVGHAAEEFLIQKMGYKTNHADFNDVISPQGYNIEVKVINHKWCNQYRIETDPRGMNLTLWTQKYNDRGHGTNARYVLVYSVYGENYTLFGGYDLETGQRL